MDRDWVTQTIRKLRQIIVMMILACAALGLVLASSTWNHAMAHETPSEARIHAFLRKEGSSLQMLIRVPMKAMQDVEWPLRGPGYLVLEGLEPKLREAATLWVIDNLTIYEKNRVLDPPRISRTRISIAADRSFSSFQAAADHLAAAPIEPRTDLHWAEQWLDVQLDYRLNDPGARLALEPRFARMGLQVRTSLRFKLDEQPERALEWHGNLGRLDLDPSWTQTSRRFIGSGIEHILSGLDHLLFILCLVLPFRDRPRALLILITAFTLAHSLTLGAAAMGLAPGSLWFVPLIETLIAASILWVAIENIFQPALGLRFATALGLGLIHGLGFSFGLQEELQFAGTHLVSALFAFNLGVEIGQLLVVAVALPVLAAATRWLDQRQLSWVMMILVAHTAWHWLLERAQVLLKFPLPAIDAAAGASLIRWLLALLLIAASAAWAWKWVGRWARKH